MPAIAESPTATEVPVHGVQHGSDEATFRLSLRATEDGWTLMAPDGETVFEGLGIAGRRQCLEFARDLDI